MTTTSFMDRVGKRWNRRHTPGDGTEPFTVQSTVEISKPVQEVWDFATSPLSTVLVDHQHLCSITVPGTPQGVGEQTCSLRREGNGRLNVTVWEVVEYEPPHRYVVKTLTGPSETVALVAIGATSNGCTYTTSVGMRIAYGTSRKVAPIAQRGLDELAAKVRSFVESGVRFETVKESLETDSGLGESDPVSPAENLP